MLFLVYLSGFFFLFQVGNYLCTVYFLSPCLNTFLSYPHHQPPSSPQWHLLSGHSISYLFSVWCYNCLPASRSIYRLPFFPIFRGVYERKLRVVWLNLISDWLSEVRIIFEPQAFVYWWPSKSNWENFSLSFSFEKFLSFDWSRVGAHPLGFL